MTCRGQPEAPNSASEGELRLGSDLVEPGLRQTMLSVPGIHCPGCIRSIERTLGALDGVAEARVNLTARRVAVRWRADGPTPPLVETLAGLGYSAHLAESGRSTADRSLGELVRALAVAGFATGNIMLLSVSVWAGADPAARSVFHWISAAIALPVLAYSGRVFYRSAWAALRHGRTNMDVPISIGVALAFGLSLYDTIHHGPHAYFDASVMLLFFLLIGRTLDHVMRARARSAVEGLARLAARGATVEGPDGTRAYVPVEEVRPGATLLVAPGERVPVDGRVLSGASELDCSLVTGESAPRRAGPGAELEAGTLNLTGLLRVRATATVGESFLAEVIRLMEEAELGRSAYRRIADRASRLYAPAVHLAAFLSFLGWMAASGDIHQGVTIAVAVLIITCPCALGLAVPMVQVVAARRLFEQGVMARDGAGLERLEATDTVVFDKTGTLTLGETRLRDRSSAAPGPLAISAAMASGSRHPHARALVAARAGIPQSPEPAFDRVAEHPGDGIEATCGQDVYRLGRVAWALGGMDASQEAGTSQTVLSLNGRLLAAYRFDDPLRPDTKEAVAGLLGAGLDVEILSGDRAEAVEAVARSLGVARWQADLRPAGKAERLRALAAEGRSVLMVGDGLNDAPALAAAQVSMAPASAADVGRNAADFVFLRDSLTAVPAAVEIARRSGRLIRQNLAVSIVYNAIALPFAVLGHVTPLFAALAMSTSSILVVVNAMRLGGRRRAARSRPAPAGALAPAGLEPRS